MAVDRTTGSALALRLMNVGAQDDDLEILLQAVKRCTSVAPHDNIVREGDAPGQVKALLAGTACSYTRQDDGARTILSFQHAGDFCDLFRYVLTDLGPRIGVQALTDCTVAVIDYQDMDRLLSRPTLASAIWRSSMLEVAIYRERLSSMRRKSALERVAHLLCEQLSRREAVGLRVAQLPLSQTDLADALGLSPVHVNRTIQTLRRLKVLSNANHPIKVVDRDQLARIAGFDGGYLNTPTLVSRWAVQLENLGGWRRDGGFEAHKSASASFGWARKDRRTEGVDRRP